MVQASNQLEIIIQGLTLLIGIPTIIWAIADRKIWQ